LTAISEQINITMHIYSESENLSKMLTALNWQEWADILPKDFFVINYLDCQETELVSFTHRAINKWKKHNLKGKNIVLVYEFEVMHTLLWTAVVDYLRSEGWENILLIDGGFEMRTPPDPNFHFAQSPFFYNCFTEKSYKDVEEAIAEKDTLFSCLGRRARYSRVRITVDLLERGLDKLGYVSCGWCPHENFFSKPIRKENKLWYQFIPEHLTERFPVTLNHPDNDQWEVEIGGLDKVCLNVVQETHVGWMYQEKYRSQTRSDRAHFTEKTAKAFWYYQLPLVFGTPWQVNLLQTRGFDMFEDIFDLSYDTEIDVYKREKLFVDQIEKFCKKPVSYWQDYMLENKARLIHNRNHMTTTYNLLVNNLKNKLKYLDTSH